jgi:hypothetical protein
MTVIFNQMKSATIERYSSVARLIDLAKKYSDQPLSRPQFLSWPHFFTTSIS